VAELSGQLELLKVGTTRGLQRFATNSKHFRCVFAQFLQGIEPILANHSGKRMKADRIALTVPNDGDEPIGADTGFGFENLPSMLYSPCGLHRTI
jgi:hypothetical protein